MSPRILKTYPESYRRCAICNGWYDSAKPEQMQIDHRGQAFCYKHTYRMDYPKGRPASLKRRRK